VKQQISSELYCVRDGLRKILGLAGTTTNPQDEHEETVLPSGNQTVSSVAMENPSTMKALPSGKLT